MGYDRLIYGLVDPTTNLIRYVGSSTKGLDRPKEHLRPCNYKFDRKVYRWIREVVEKGSLPKIVVLEEVARGANLIDAETWWMRYLRCFGCDLTNSTGSAGGTGMTGKKHSVSTKKRISDKKTGVRMSSEACRNISLSKKGKAPPRANIDACTAAKIGKKRSEDTKLKISEKLKGVKQTDERKTAHSIRMKKWWEERRGGL